MTKNMKNVAKMRVLVDRYVDDDISGNLLSEWIRRHHADRLFLLFSACFACAPLACLHHSNKCSACHEAHSGDPEHFVFPRWVHRSMVWDKPLRNSTHNKMIQHFVRTVRCLTIACPGIVFFSSYSCDRPKHMTYIFVLPSMWKGLDEERRALLYTSTSIRRGNQVGTEVEVQRYRAMRNKDFGWAQ